MFSRSCFNGSSFPLISCLWVPQALAILNRLYYLRTTKLLVGYSSCSSPLILAGGASRDTICLASPARAATVAGDAEEPVSTVGPRRRKAQLVCYKAIQSSKFCWWRSHRQIVGRHVLVRFLFLTWFLSKVTRPKITQISNSHGSQLPITLLEFFLVGSCW